MADLNSSAGHLFSIGVIADVQYADADDGYDHRGTSLRCYRGALTVLDRAVGWFDAFRSGSAGLAFVAQLGDLLDGQNARAGTSATALQKLIAIINRSQVPFINLVGNHELYNFDRELLALRLGTRPEGRTREFYATSPVPGVLVLILDAFQEAVIGWPAEEPRRQVAVTRLRSKQSNFDPDDWFKGLEGDERRFTPVNGAFGDEQLGWLERQLKAAVAAQQRVIILSHVVLHPRACKGTTMVMACS